MPDWYPIFIKLKNEKILVVGGGTVATRKVKTLINYSPQITIVSPSVSSKLKALISKYNLKYYKRNYRKSDLKNKKIVFVATSNGTLNEQIFQDAQQSGILVNIADSLEHCSFIVPSIMARGDLQIAISTSGISPLLTKTIRNKLEELFGSEYNTLLKLIRKYRSIIKKKFNDVKVRKIKLEKLLHPSIIKKIKNGDIKKVEEEFKRIIEEDV